LLFCIMFNCTNDSVPTQGTLVVSTPSSNLNLLV